MPFFNVFQPNRSQQRGQIESEKSYPHATLMQVFWDDYGYMTMFILLVVDEGGLEHDIGNVKFGRFDMGDKRTPDLPATFDNLGEQFFSLGQNPEYYANLNGLSDYLRGRILNDLRDVAFDLKLFDKALDINVTKQSLMRYIDENAVRSQFHRIALGGTTQINYKCLYEYKDKYNDLNLTFDVIPNSMPRTNIHVLIGRNGVGKTYHLNNMAQCLLTDVNSSKPGVKTSFSVNSESESTNHNESFLNLISVTFSAFDNFQHPKSFNKHSEGNDITYSYIGLKEEENVLFLGYFGFSFNSEYLDKLAQGFAESFNNCRVGGRRELLKSSIQSLESDPVFKDLEITALFDRDVQAKDLVEELKTLFLNNLSSGHKIVLLSITRIVEKVEERTLVLLDEPEVHLHPPLLSAFIRSLSDLLTHRNGVAILATHSPVVLQEVPSKCVWRLRSTGLVVVADRLSIETFGENVGVLTHEVFGLEVRESGFYKLLKEAVEETNSFEEARERFTGELGSEANAILRVLAIQKKRREGNQDSI